MSHHYRVRWEIDVEADDPVQAAREAVEIMKQPYAESIAHVFDVRLWTDGPDAVPVRVDLDKLDGKDME
jgi:hypothetical protein